MRMDATKMTNAAIPKGDVSTPLDGNQLSGKERQQSQQVICGYFLSIVKTWSSELIIFEFQRLFIQFSEEVEPKVWEALDKIIQANDEFWFQDILIRCCYTLINNWQTGRNYKPIQEFIKLFEEDRTIISARTSCENFRTLRKWMINFCESTDYHQLKLLASRYNSTDPNNWSNRFNSYLLVDLYVENNNSRGQREAARALSQQLKDRFKFDLAMYTARCLSPIAKAEQPIHNPTSLGDDVLRLIKTVVAKRGTFSYANVANIFCNQIAGVSYKGFKRALSNYLIYSVEDRGFVETIKTQLCNKIEALFEDNNEDIVNDRLILATCNRVIDYLTTENGREPSLLFILLLSHRNPLTLVIVMLKIVLISPSTHVHLEARLAKLIRHYEARPVEECKWLVNFLDIFQITFAIHADNVEYNLIAVDDKTENSTYLNNGDNYRIFSFMKKPKK